MKNALRSVLVGMSTLIAFTINARADVFNFGPGQYDNTANVVNAGPTPVNNQKTGSFRDVFWYSLNNGAPREGSPDFINQGNSLTLQSNHGAPGPGPISALNFTGPAVSGGTTYLAVYDTTPADGVTNRNLINGNGLEISADVLFVKHSSSAGVVAFYSEGQDGIALLAHNGDGNNPDHARVDLVFQSGGQGTVLANTNLPANSFQVAASANGNKTVGATDFWYRVVLKLTVSGDAFTALGTFFNHSDSNDPNSALGSQIASLSFSGLLSDPDAAALHLTNPGEVGVVAMGNESIALPDNIGVSITNFQISSVPEPTSVLLFGTVAALVGNAFRRRFA